MSTIKMGNFEFSTYILIIGLAFVIAFAVFYRLLKNKISKLDICYVYAINIVGYAISSKCLSVILSGKAFTLYNFMNSGYSYLGGMIGSILFIVLYCKKYDLNFRNILSAFSVIYPLIYSICKIGCFLNNCCSGLIRIGNLSFSLQLVDFTLMLVLFFVLLMQFKNEKDWIVSKFLIVFSVIRFIEDYCRYDRHIIVYNLSAEQFVCVGLIAIGILVLVFLKYIKLSKLCDRGMLKDEN